MSKTNKKTKHPIGINLESKVDDVGVSVAAGAIVEILEAAFSAHADQETVRAALNALTTFGGLHGASLANCSVSMGTK